MSTEFGKLEKKNVEIYSLFPELFIPNRKVATEKQAAAFLQTIQNMEMQWRWENAAPRILDDMQV